MASVATDRQEGTKPAKPPISTHPLFPAIVALWFAALLGVGSLVLPAVLLERAAMATGIAAVIPAAAPPFGPTARILIALAFTLVGITAGLLIARRVARAHATNPAAHFSQGRSESVTRAPINAHEELGHEGFDGQASGRRRSLAVREDEGPSKYDDRAPPPGTQELSWPAAAERIDAGEPLELSAIAEEAGEDSPSFGDAGDERPSAPADEDDSGPFYEPYQTEVEATASGQAFDPPLPNAEIPDEELSDREAFEPESFEQEVPERQEFIPGEPEEPETEPGPVESGGDMQPEDPFAPPAAPHSEPESDPEPIGALPFSPASLSRGKQLEIAQAHNDAGDAPVEPPLHAESDGEEMAEKDMPENSTNDWSETPPDELGLVQLAQRLGSAIERRREYMAARAAQEPAPPTDVPSGFEVAEPDEAALAKDAYFGEGRAAPASEQEDARTEEAPLAPPDSSHKQPAPESKPENGESARQVFPQNANEPAPKPYQPFAGFGPEQGSSEEDEDEIEELAASFSLPVDRQAAKPLFLRPDAEEEAMPPAAEVPAERAEAPQVEEEGESPDRQTAPVSQGYGSLLGIKNPFKAGGEKFVRIDEEEFGINESDDGFEPTVVFPAQQRQPRSDVSAGESEAVETGPVRAFDPPRQSAAQPSKRAAQPSGNNDADEMLREALLNLQRTSGAA